jgi:DNA-binding transcriptional regulator YiaG
MRPIEHIRRNIFNVSQQVFAKIAGTTQSTVSRWESGELNVTDAEMRRIRQAARRRKLAWQDSWFFELPEQAVA